jgi:hypothetical protein
MQAKLEKLNKPLPKVYAVYLKYFPQSAVMHEANNKPIVKARMRDFWGDYFAITQELRGTDAQLVLPAVTVYFSIVEVRTVGKLDKSRAALGEDYSLVRTDKNKQNPQNLQFTSTSEITMLGGKMIVTTTFSSSASIPTNAGCVYLKVNPVFDWEDEAELEEAGEKFSVTLTSASGAYIIDTGEITENGEGETEIIHPDRSSAELEILDGGYVKLMIDSNNDGQINEDDNNPLVKNHSSHPGHIMEVNYDDDNENEIEDRTEISSLHNSVINAMALNGHVNITVDDEDDIDEVLVRAKVYCLTPKTSNDNPEIDIWQLLITHQIKTYSNNALGSVKK